MQYAAWIEQWLSRKEQLVKESTFAAYSNIAVNHLLPKFSHFELDAFNEEIIQEYAFELLKKGRLDGTGGMGERSAKDIIIVLKNSLRDAMRLKKIPLAVYEIRFPNNQNHYKVTVLPPAEQQRLIQAVYLSLTPKSAGILLSLYTGMRIGEVCALRWENIDLENKMINVTQTVQRIYKKDLTGAGKSKLLMATPKTRSSARSIPISQLLLPILRKFQTSDTQTFFISGHKKCVEVRTFRTFFDSFLNKNEISKFNFHVLRHTFATRCIEAGGDCKTVSELLGHASVNITLNLYVHPQVEQKRRCVEMMAEIM